MEKVEELIVKALEELLSIDSEGTCLQSDSKLIYPQYRKEEGEAKRRVSEQEARFLFVKQLEGQTDYSYSVETPTSLKYSGFTEGKPIIDETNGRSARIDVCLYTKEKDYKRKHLIEFKAHNMKQGDINKDFLKLKYDNINRERTTNYFVHILDSFDNGTKTSLLKKYRAAFDYYGTEADDEDLVKNEVKIFVCLLSSKPDHILLLNDKSNLEEELNKLLLNKTIL
ncbi:hypothetical protein FACS1894181_06040 [Bacteroidia bacterium]|nr:hypothetical protein FACS1894181_06040 [Bacteroidia bacterium]